MKDDRNIIFLDIDGVMLPGRSYLDPERLILNKNGLRVLSIRSIGGWHHTTAMYGLCAVLFRYKLCLECRPRPYCVLHTQGRALATQVLERAPADGVRPYRVPFPS